MKCGDLFDFKGRFRWTVFVTLPMGSRKELYKSEWVENIVTNTGKELLISRLGSNTGNFINAIGIGTGSAVPDIDDVALATETYRKVATPTNYGSPDWKVVFNAVFSATEINGSMEIGLLNSSTSGGILVTRSIHSPISVPPGSSISIDYELGLLGSSLATSWVKTSGRTNVYEIAQTQEIIGVREVDESGGTTTGYVRRTTIPNVDSNPGSFYWVGDATNKLYIHTSGSSNPSSLLIYTTFGG